MGKYSRIEVVLWSIALPGFGQLLNERYLKGLLFIVLELIINSQSKLNEVIISSFHGNTAEAIVQTNYQWLMFYPCIYMFAIWDAYKDAGGGTSRYAVVPVVFGAYFGTIGIIFSLDLLGAVWLGLIGMVVGLAVGVMIKRILIKREITSGQP